MAAGSATRAGRIRRPVRWSDSSHWSPCTETVSVSLMESKRCSASCADCASACAGRRPGRSSRKDQQRRQPETSAIEADGALERGLGGDRIERRASNRGFLHLHPHSGRPVGRIRPVRRRSRTACTQQGGGRDSHRSSRPHPPLAVQQRQTRRRCPSRRSRHRGPRPATGTCQRSIHDRPSRWRLWERTRPAQPGGVSAPLRTPARRTPSPPLDLCL